jgi:hypothetical protein
MPSLNFQKRFALMVETGQKPHTIRATRKRPIQVGDTLHLFTGMRQKGCRRLRPATICTSAVTIHIDAKEGFIALDAETPRYQVGDRYTGLLTIRTTERLVKNDGFANEDDFFAWFLETHGPLFTGQLIEWTP